MARQARGWGEGAIFKRKDGRWYAVLSLGTDPFTDRRIRRELSGKSKQEVQQKLTLLRDEANGTGDATITLSQWMERWLGSLRSRVRPSTHSLYTTIVKTHITLAIGYVLLSKLTPSSVQHFYATLEAKGVSARTRQAIHARLFAGLKAAVRLGLIVRNVADSVDSPRYSAPEVSPLSVVEVRGGTLCEALRSVFARGVDGRAARRVVCASHPRHRPGRRNAFDQRYAQR